MFKWASEYEELFKVCTLFNLTEVGNPKRYHYESLKGYIQEGPQCGLVALAIASKNPSKQFVENILKFAKEHEFTYNGEVFSSKYMETMANFFLGNKYRSYVFHGELNCAKTKEHLLDGGLILVPYDTDKDNSPGLYNGNKSHWAVICGAVETEEGFWVISRHGKVKNVAIWNIAKLSDSNKQLNEFFPDDKNSHLQFKLPEGGLGGTMGLRNTAVFIEKLCILE